MGSSRTPHGLKPLLGGEPRDGESLSRRLAGGAGAGRGRLCVPRVTRAAAALVPRAPRARPARLQHPFGVPHPGPARRGRAPAEPRRDRGAARDAPHHVHRGRRPAAPAHLAGAPAGPGDPRSLGAPEGDARAGGAAPRRRGGLTPVRALGRTAPEVDAPEARAGRARSPPLHAPHDLRRLVRRDLRERARRALRRGAPRTRGAAPPAPDPVRRLRALGGGVARLARGPLSARVLEGAARRLPAPGGAPGGPPARGGAELPRGVPPVPPAAGAGARAEGARADERRHALHDPPRRPRRAREAPDRRDRRRDRQHGSEPQPARDRAARRLLRQRARLSPRPRRRPRLPRAPRAREGCRDRRVREPAAPVRAPRRGAAAAAGPREEPALLPLPDAPERAPLGAPPGLTVTPLPA